MKKVVIIVAGGSGKRMKSQLPKQFLPLQGLPVLVHTINAFHKALSNLTIIIVLPKVHINLWEELCKTHNFTIPHQVCVGGKERFHSVQNALKMVDDDAVVAIHDAVRPLVPPDVIASGFETAEKNGCAIPVVPLRDSLRIIQEDMSLPLNRSNVRAVQTPQCFQASLIKEAYLAQYSPLFTDDATVAENAGYDITLFDGHEANFKITTPFDMFIAEIYFKHNIPL